ncbi:MAG: hypothetical protein Q4P07_09345 [Ornithinimicrobium sp.]|uniref:hypothetical protein n=1 Tax=Ornithinimicrobium sp. TaxID=1977084 RepID=UPI0026DF7C76|nr:hypothetical protein [Ornithinimicrobium sp.]MDO5740340.1 hypothetical protein [Ornithinimicrobium sp.]
MFALVLAMLFCVAIGAGVVGYVMLEARREGRGDFWTAEGEELIAGARRTTEKVVARSEELGRTAAGRTKGLAARLPERAHGQHTSGQDDLEVSDQEADQRHQDLRAAS